MKSSFFEKIDKIEKLLVRLNKEKRENTQKRKSGIEKRKL